MFSGTLPAAVVRLSAISVVDVFMSHPGWGMMIGLSPRLSACAGPGRRGASWETLSMQSESSRKRIVVVGGGITGLAAAHRIMELAGPAGIDLEIQLFEARDKLGGSIQTTHREGFLLEGGPDSFITQKPWALALCRRLGLADQLISTNPAYRRTFVVRRGKLHPLPEGFLLLAPTRIWPFVISRLFSWRAIVRYLLITEARTSTH